MFTRTRVFIDLIGEMESRQKISSSEYYDKYYILDVSMFECTCYVCSVHFCNFTFDVMSVTWLRQFIEFNIIIY